MTPQEIIEDNKLIAEAVTFWRLAFVADFGTLICKLKKKVNMKYESLIPERLGNDANRLLYTGIFSN